MFNLEQPPIPLSKPTNKKTKPKQNKKIKYLHSWTTT